MRYFFRSYLPEIVLSATVFLWAVLFCTLGFLQYQHFLYDAFDLGIYTQVFWNIVHGHGFAYTFNHYSYLADHREWILLLLAPVFTVLQHPLTLVYVQILLIASATYPLYQIVCTLYGRGRRIRWCAALVCVAFLCHPVIQHMVLYEFHALVCVVPATFFLWRAFLQRRWAHVYIWACVLLCVREDVGLMLALASILMFFESRTRHDRAHSSVVGVVSLMYAMAMVVLGGRWFPGGSEKFFVFYPQLGTSLHDVLFTLLTHPFRAFSPVLGFDHLWIVGIFVTSVAAVCLCAPRYLTPALAPFILLALIPRDMLASVLNTHYAAPIIVWVVLATVYGFRRIQKMRFRRIRLAVLVAVSSTIFLHSIVLSGALFEYSRVLTSSAVSDPEEAWQMLSHVAPSDSVLVSQTFMAPLSLRREIYPMLQVFTGKDHYAETAYQLPEHVDWVIWSPRDMIEMTVNFPFADVGSGFSRIEKVITANHLVLLKQSADSTVYGHPDALNSQELPTVFGEPLSVETILLGISLQKCLLVHAELLQCTFVSQGSQANADMHAVIEWRSADGRVVSTQFATLLDDDLRPSHLWTASTPVIVGIPLQHLSEVAAYVELHLVGITQQAHKFLFSRKPIDITTLLHVEVDLTSLFDEVRGK